MTFPVLWTNKVKLNTSQGGGKNFTLAIGLRAKYNYSSLLIFSTLFTFQLYSVFSCALSWNCFVFDRRPAWAGLMLLATGSHSQQRCSTTIKGVNIKQWKRGSHACCYCIIALLSSIHLWSGYSFNLTHSANYALTWSTKIVHYHYSNFNAAIDY